MTTPRHRAPPPPPLWVRLNQRASSRVWLIAGGPVVCVVCSTVGIADSVGDGITPVVRGDVVALPSRAAEPTGRGGPVAPIFADVDAPHYEPEPVPPASTPRGQVTVPPRRVVAATSAPSAAQPPPAGNPVTPKPAPAEPGPVVGLPAVPIATPQPVEQPADEPQPTPIVPVVPDAQPQPVAEPPVDDIETPAEPIVEETP